MPVSVAAGVATVTTSAIDGTETVPVLMSALIATAEIAAGTNGTALDPDHTPAVISGISLASPGVISFTAAHGLSVGDKVFISGIVGTTELNNRSVTVLSSGGGGTNITVSTERATSFTSDAVSTAGYTAWVSGGTVQRLLNSGQLIGVRMDIGTNAWLKIDNNYHWTARTTTRFNPLVETAGGANNGGAVVLGYRSTSWIRTNTFYADSDAYACRNGGRFFALRTPNGQNPSVIHDVGTRHDWPTLDAGVTPAEYRIEGLFVRGVGDSRKWYGGNSRNVGGRDLLANLQLSGSGEIFQAYNTQYQSPLIPLGFVGGEYAASNIQLVTPTFFSEAVATGAINSSSLRVGRVWITDPNFNNWWNGTISITAEFSAGAYMGIRTTHTMLTKRGTTVLTTPRIRRSRVVTGTPVGYNLSTLVYLPEAATTFATVNGSGISVQVCTLAFCGHTVGGLTGAQLTEYYVWDVKCRDFANKTPGEWVAQARTHKTGNNLERITEEIQLLPVTNLTVTEAVAATITGIAFVPSGTTSGTVTISSSLSLQTLWNYYRWWQKQDANFNSEDTWDFDGTTLNCGAWNITVAGGSTLSGGILTTTGAITVTGSVDLTSYTGSGGTFVRITASGLVAGSRYQLFNVTDATEIANAIAAGTTISQYVAFTVAKTIRLRVAYQSGTTAKLEWIGTGVLSAGGLPFLVAQQDDPIYIANAINGSTVTEFTADFPNVQIDVSDPDNTTTVQRLYAWYVATLMTADGIRNFFDAIYAEDLYNYQVHTDIASIKLDNTSANPVIIIGARLYRDDDATVIAATSGSIQMDPAKAYLAQAPLLDVAVSTRLAASSYTAPPTVSAIRTEIDANSTKLDVAVGTRLATAGYTAPANSDVAAIKAKTDQLAFTSGNVHANAEMMNGAEVIGNGQTGNAWRGVGVSP